MIYQNMETIDKTCDICYKEISNKVSLDCGHELCVMCFLEIMGNSRGFKCHMCRRQYDWKKDKINPISSPPEETLSILIREDEDCQFRALVGMETSRAFEVIVNEQNIQFIVILHSQIDTETLKFLISEFIASNIPLPFMGDDDVISSLRRPAAFGHFKNTGSHLESFYDNLVIKKYED